MEPIAEHLERERARLRRVPRLEGARSDGAARPGVGEGLRRCASRCSSSRARARDAARPRTSSSSPSSSATVLLVANATGCSSIYGGNLPTTPWGTDAAGRGPAWSNSLFEDNAEFGLGMRIALDRQSAHRPDGWSPSSPRSLGDELARQCSRSTRRCPSTMRRSRRNGLGSSRASATGSSTTPTPRSIGAQRRAVCSHAHGDARAQERVDRRGRRLGVRHRRRRSRPRAGVRARRERPRARHRGVLEHGRAGVEVHAAWRGGEIRRPAEAHPEEGPRDSMPRRTATCTSRRSRSVRTTSRRSRRSSRPRRGRDRR